MSALPYRPNVGAALFNRQGLVFVGRRCGTPDGWQLPQGGIDDDESPEEAVRRELREEIGVENVEVLASLPDWLTYEFPAGLAAPIAQRWRGQRQMWFALRLLGPEEEIRLDRDDPPEFDAWRWVRLDELPSLAVPFKRPVYEAVAKAFAPFAAP